MKNFKYLVTLISCLVFAPEHEVESFFIANIVSPSNQQIMISQMEMWVRQDSELFLTCIRGNWQNLYLFLNSGDQNLILFGRWALQNLEVFFSVIEEYDHLGQKYCVWQTIHQVGAHSWWLHQILRRIPFGRLFNFIHKYFQQIKNDTFQDQQDNRPLQANEWVVPCIALINYRIDLFGYLLDKEPEERIMWLGFGDMDVLDYWLKNSPQCLYRWLSAYWHDFAKIMIYKKYEPIFWRILLQADRAWLIRHRFEISKILQNQPDLLENDWQIQDFIVHNKNDFIAILEQQPKLVRSLFHKYQKDSQATVLPYIKKYHNYIYEALLQIEQLADSDENEF